MNAKLLFIHALSALHPGVGQGAGVIDLPIAREKATGIPFLPGSSLKGALRARCKTRGMQQECFEIFGPENIDDINNSASMIQFADQRLLLLPIRSLAGTFTWVTSPFILNRFARDAYLIQDTTDWLVDLPDITDESCLITTNDIPASPIVVTNQNTAQMIYLEDLNLIPKYDTTASRWAQMIAEHVFPGNIIWQNRLIERFCIVSDDVLSFLTETGTEITARIRLQEDSKTVQDGGLWYEEKLPAETILAGLCVATPMLNEKGLIRKKPEDIFTVVQDLINTPIQLGGKATIGYGFCQVRMEKNTSDKESK